MAGTETDEAAGGYAGDVGEDGERVMQVMLADRNCFLALLAGGWCLQWIVEPMPGSHGLYAICLEKYDD